MESKKKIFFLVRTPSAVTHGGRLSGSCDEFRLIYVGQAPAHLWNLIIFWHFVDNFLATTIIFWLLFFLTFFFLPCLGMVVHAASPLKESH